MATNYIGTGNVIDVPLETAVISGEMRMLENVLGVALSSGAIGDIVAFELVGVWTLPCSGDAFLVGQPLTYDVAGDTLYFSETPTVGDIYGVGMSFSPGGGAAEECNVKINTHLGVFVVAP